MRKVTAGMLRIRDCQRTVKDYLNARTHSSICHCLGCRTRRSDKDGRCKCKLCTTYGTLTPEDLEGASIRL